MDMNFPLGFILLLFVSRNQFSQFKMELIVVILFQFGISNGDHLTPEKVRPKLKASDFICHSEAIKSSLDGYLEPEQLNKFIETTMAQRLQDLGLGDEFNEIDTVRVQCTVNIVRLELHVK